VAARIHPVILSGGSGTRLWPLSRQARPKQFLALTGERSLLQDTVTRVQGVRDCVAPIVVSNNEHRFMVAEQLHELGVRPAAQLLEPAARNTAPAVAAAAFHVEQSDPDGILLVLPSDHVIGDGAAFGDTVARAARAAAAGRLVTFGIRAGEPNTGYGYIERGKPLTGETDVHQIDQFVEKPNIQMARGYVASGRFLWNSGMFVFLARRYLEELQRLQPEIWQAAQAALAGAVRDLDFIRLDRAAFERSPSISIDYAVMEKTDAGAVVEAHFPWSDVGSWPALWEIGEKDAAGNVVHGDVHTRGAKDCYLWSEERLLVALGVQDLMVIETGDALLVADRSRAQEVKEVVQELQQRKRTEHLTHTRVYRPWGYYEGIDAGERFQVKRIVVKPGEALSLQMHHHRAEHWVVVSGTAKVTRGDEVLMISENQSTYIPLGVKHRLENVGKVPLYLIEVQSGGYLGEDDIVRFDDRYRRS
jgi:mannose-1-phosphate guanylyltransferase/mannose-6-phosphate isomerase